MAHRQHQIIKKSNYYKEKLSKILESMNPLFDKDPNYKTKLRKAYQIEFKICLESNFTCKPLLPKIDYEIPFIRGLTKIANCMEALDLINYDLINYKFTLQLIMRGLVEDYYSYRTDTRLNEAIKYGLRMPIHKFSSKEEIREYQIQHVTETDHAIPDMEWYYISL